MRRISLAILVWTASLVWMSPLAHAFGVAPALIELEGARGTVLDGEFTAINTSDADQTYYLEAIGFAPGDGNGVPQFLSEDDSSTGLPDWVRFPHASITLPARSSASVPFQVAIPADIASGGYYAAIVVSDTPSEVVADNGVSLNARMAVLLFLTVSGDTVEKAALLDFASPDEIGDVPSISYVYRIQNQGNVHVRPEATITVTDVFGRTLFVVDANQEASRVLPGTTREFSGQIGPADDSFVEHLQSELKTFAIGPVTYTLEVRYGSSDDVLSKTVEQMIIPSAVILVGACAVAVTTVLYLLYVAGMRKRPTI